MSDKAESISAPTLVGCLQIKQVSAQTAVAMNATVTAVGFGINAGMDSLIVQVAPASACHLLVHQLLARQPSLELGMLLADGPVGQLEVHSDNADYITAAKLQIEEACLINADPAPEIACTRLGLLTNVADAHANLVNRNRNSALLVAGDNLLQIAVSPAIAALALVQRLSQCDLPVKLIDIRLSGPQGRLYLAGELEILERLEKEWSS